MKGILKKTGSMIYSHRRDILDLLLCAVILVGFFWFGVLLRGLKADRDLKVWKTIATTPAPEECVLCGDWSYHAPCLMKLSTGQKGELQIYDNAPGFPGELAEEQTLDEGVFYNIANGATASRAAESRTNYAHAEKNDELIDPSLYCFDCRVLLADTAVEGFVLLDMIDPDAVKVYKIEENTEYRIRDYTVTIERSDQFEGYEIVTKGHLWIEE